MTAPHSEDRYIIEREGEALGMVIGEPHGYVIYACAQHIWPLDRQVFQSLGAAEKEIAIFDKITSAKEKGLGRLKLQVL